MNPYGFQPPHAGEYYGPQQYMAPPGAQAALPPSPYGAPQPMGQPMGREAIPPLEESYVENILRWNRNKPATIYATFENNPEWPARTFVGKVETAGRDHVIVSDDKGVRYIIPMVNVDYIAIPGELTYYPPPGTRR